ncbi:MAG: cysteine-rich CWC family protein [Bacteroidota bacterium]|nr:cysteine-rich CWC family protein [Bacteroidota bacterium]
MNKKCPHCGKEFECRHDDIVNCQCATVVLTPEERQYLASIYNDCVCVECIKKLKEEFRRRECRL